LSPRKKEISGAISHSRNDFIKIVKFYPCSKHNSMLRNPLPSLKRIKWERETSFERAQKRVKFDEF
jgi:hypothetical protein